MEGKVAITALGSDGEALFSPHFAIASHFLLYDPATGEVTAVEIPPAICVPVAGWQRPIS
ncbi:MAG TPA: hypothetical protein EYP63_00225 [Desulfotomaculum sp.]|nr:hypothetical protein [Desulfotomaculum sp.]